MLNTVDLGKQLDNIYVANTCKCVIPEQNVRKKHWEEKKKSTNIIPIKQYDI